MMGKLEEIQIFVRVVEAGGIGKAAEQLNLAKSAVSRRLSDLESRLACKLIQRTTRTSSLTEAGRVYYEHALKLLESVEEMDGAVQQKEADLRGTLRISVPVSFGLSHLSSLIGEFADLNPNLSLHVDFSDREVDMVEQGFDLAFRIGALKEASIQARSIVPIRFVLCASPDYLRTHGEPSTPEALKSHPLMQYTAAESDSWPLTDPEGQVHSVQMSGRIQANNGDFLRDMAIAGQGIVLSPTFIVWQALKKGELVQVLENFRLPQIQAYAVYPQNRYLSSKARHFIDFLVERFQHRAYWDDALSDSGD